jgi:hypothetical protein
MQMMQGTPAWRADQASARPWLPVETAVTPVVPGRNRGYPGGAGFELQHRVHRAAQFESAGSLQVFVRQQYVLVELLR